MIKELHTLPPRFRNQEDAMLFMECVKLRKPFPPEKWVHPFEEKDFGPPTGKRIVKREEYKNARYEARYIYNDD